MREENGRYYRYWGPFKEEWYTYSSKLRNNPHPKSGFGSWHNVWLGKVDRYFYNRHYRLWHWWVNNTPNRSLRSLEKAFPRLGHRLTITERNWWRRLLERARNLRD